MRELVAQVQQVVPSLGEGFVEVCLAFHNFSPETVIVALLEDNLPPQLVSLDRQLPRYRVHQGKKDHGTLRLGEAMKDEAFARAQRAYVAQLYRDQDEKVRRREWSGVDAGGSASRRNTDEGTPRRVCCGWMAVNEKAETRRDRESE